MQEMWQCDGAWFLDLGVLISWVRVTVKRISREYSGNVPLSLCLLLDVGWTISWVRKTSNRISKICWKCASVMVPLVRENCGARETIEKRSRKYSGNVSVSWCLLFWCGWENFMGTGTMKRISRGYNRNVPVSWCLRGNISWVREIIKTFSAEYGGNMPVSWCLLFGSGWEHFVGTGDNYEHISRRCGTCAGVMVPTV